jgi:hypothetical protein
MTTTNMARLSDMARMACGGALDGAIRMEIFNVLKEFFARTDAWLLELPIYIQPYIMDYQINTCQNAIVNRLMGLGRPQTPPDSTTYPLGYVTMCPPQFLAAYEGGTAYEGQNPAFRTGRLGVLLNAGAKCPILRIGENPNAEQVWIATFAMNICDPTDSEGFTEPPDWVMERYLNAIASGVKCQLMLQPGKPYSSLPGAQYHGKKFNDGVGTCRTEVRRMFTYGSQRWGFPGGWNSGSGLAAGGARW